jgi:signal transduction histidine kinase
MLDKLINNAIDFHTNSVISLVLFEKDSWCYIQLRNVGPSLPDDLATQIFQPMVSKRDLEQDKTVPHLGLGLYIVKLIVDKHSGKVSAKNKQEGVEFLVALPILSIN